MPADHYETLGVERSATQDEIRRAYRQLARRLHPDANPDDADAADRFKEVTRAYEVLSDPDKRQRYDAFGDERAGAAGFADFGGISDLFASFFGGGAGTRPRGPARGADVLADVALTLEEAASGVERDVRIETAAECDDCAGSGSAPGTHPVRCNHCGGSGEIRIVRQSFFGEVMSASTCPQCGGRGRTIVEPCKRCRGNGRVTVADTLTVKIPPGIYDGARLRVSGRGHAGTRGGRSGDLYVQIDVAPHPVFRRAGDDLGCEVSVPMTVAALGGPIEVETLDGREEIEVAPGTQSGSVVRLRGHGMPRLDGPGRGELVVLLKVETPTGLDADQAELLARLAALRDETVRPAKGLFDRIKQAFR